MRIARRSAVSPQGLHSLWTVDQNERHTDTTEQITQARPWDLSEIVDLPLDTSAPNFQDFRAAQIHITS